MKRWWPVIGLARHSLVALLLALVLGVVLYAYSAWLKNQAQTELTQAQQLHSSAQSGLVALQTEVTDLQSQMACFGHLRQQGVVGVANRAHWVDQLLAAHQRLGLRADTLDYTLQLAKPLSAGGALTVPMLHDLDFVLHDVHETELLNLLQDYQARVQGRFLVNACHLSERGNTGLTARCTLRFFTLSPEVEIKDQLGAIKPCLDSACCKA